MSGLLDLAAVGNIIDMSSVIDIRRYRPEIIPLVERAEQKAAQISFWEFVSKLSKTHVLVHNNKAVDIKTGFFEKELLKFAAGLVIYKRTVHDLDGCHQPADIRSAVCQHFQEQHDDLKTDLNILLSSDPPIQGFHYTGPNFTVRLRTKKDQVLHAFDSAQPGKFPANSNDEVLI
jgi:hypothetical protein